MDKIGFEARVRALWPGMVRLARCVTHSHADAEDAAAQAVLNCYRRLAPEPWAAPPERDP